MWTGKKNLCKFIWLQSHLWSHLLFLTDLVGVGPRPAAYWVLWQLPVFFAEEPCCSWKQAHVWHWTFLQVSDWTAWPCSQTPSASLSAPAKTKKKKKRSNIHEEELMDQYKWGSMFSPLDVSVNQVDKLMFLCRCVFSPGSPCETGPHHSACRVCLCPGSSSSASPELLVCPSRTVLTDWKRQTTKSRQRKSRQTTVWEAVWSRALKRTQESKGCHKLTRFIEQTDIYT